jgi:GNAT superfamily N-acetyltransferase
MYEISHFIVRFAAPADLPAMLALYAHLNPDDQKAQETKAETAWDALLSSSLVKVFVAEMDGAIVSSCTIVIVPNVTRGVRPYALIENVVTHGDYRGRGLGHAVLAAALDAAWERDCYKVMLATGSPRPETFRFYEGAGFVRGGKTFFEARPAAKTSQV